MRQEIAMMKTGQQLMIGYDGQNSPSLESPNKTLSDAAYSIEGHSARR